MNIKDFFNGVRYRKMKYRTRTVRYKNSRFTVEVADTFRKVATGLMNHDSLDRDRGMLFIFNRDGKHGFWMLNMKFGIDIIWLNSDCEVVHIVRNAQPCESIFNCKTYRPPLNSRYVLELHSGAAARLDVKTGDRFAI